MFKTKKIDSNSEANHWEEDRRKKAEEKKKEEEGKRKKEYEKRKKENEQKKKDKDKLVSEKTPEKLRPAGGQSQEGQVSPLKDNSHR